MNETSRMETVSFPSSVQQFVSQRAKSRELYARALAVMPSGTTRNTVFYRPFPAYVDHATGSHVYFVDGNESIDYCFNQSSLILGHNHPNVMHAIVAQIERGTALGGPTETEIGLAETIHNRYPSAEKVRFAGTGTEAIMNGLRLARAYSGKNKIAKFEGQFHGTYDSVYVSVNTSVDGRKHGPALVAIPESEGMPPSVRNDTVVLPLEDIEATEEAIKKNRDELAVLIVEPLAKPRGYTPMKSGFLRTLRDITTENDVLLMFDEVVTGFRLSEGGAAKMFQVQPDLAAFGKNIGGGFPVGAFGGSTEIMQLYDIPENQRPRISASGTWNAHPLAMAAGLSTLRELTQATYDRMETRSKELRDGMNQAFANGGILGRVTGFSSLFNLYFSPKEVVDYETATQSNRFARWLFDIEMLNRGAFYTLNQGWFNISAVTSTEDIRFTLDQSIETLNTIRPTLQEKAEDLLVRS